MNTANVTLGFIPLLDCATLVVAAEKGFAAAEGLDLRLVRESSWANVRDRVLVGHFDAAHMLGPMVVAASLGAGHLHVPMVAPVALGLGGNAITVSGSLWSQMSAQGAQLGAAPGPQGAALARVVTLRAKAQLPPFTFAMVFPFSCHNYELRYWLAASGIDPDRDVRLVVLPPPLLVDALRSGQVDGFCVGEPWNSLAVATGIGCIAAATSDIWQRGPEKVLGMRRDWAERHPAQVAALVRAVAAAARWCDAAENRMELATLLSEPRFVGAPADLLRGALEGRLPFAQGTVPVERPDFITFARYDATLPWPEHAAWFYVQMRQWGQLDAAPGQLEVARGAYRPDLYRSALQGLPAGSSLPPEPAAPGSRFFDEPSSAG
jgi:ABC-type nitrate/sulfonate/bicarbonate transport system substrate-binding protein